MSLSYDRVDNFDIISNWDEYNMLDTKMNENLSQINKMCQEFNLGHALTNERQNQMVSNRNSYSGDKARWIVLASIYWWMLATSFLKIYFYQLTKSNYLLTYH